MSAAWPLAAAPEDDLPLPEPWNTEIDVSDPQTESALLTLLQSQPTLALRVCRSAFCSAEARGDKQAALHALYLACVSLNVSSQRGLADRVFGVVLERARGIGLSDLSTRIQLNHAKQLQEQGEFARAMIIRQHALDAAMQLGGTRLMFFALGAVATSAMDAGQAELALSLCEQQEPLLRDDGVIIDAQRCHRANIMAVAWMTIARASKAAGDHIAAQAALRSAHGLAMSASAMATNDWIALHCLETVVDILLQLDDAVQARAHVNRCTARLSAVPSIGSTPWCVLEVARARIELHDGSVGVQTLDTLLMIESSLGEASSAAHVVAAEVRQVLLQTLEQLGKHEQALAAHKRATERQAERRSARSRQHMKMLRHAVLAMRAEAVEFVTHDLLTPLAAAQTWLQALHAQPLLSEGGPSLREAQRLLEHTGILSDQYLGLLRAELMPREQLQVLDIGALADDVCESVVPAASSGLRFTRAIDIDTPVLGDATLLKKALTALLADAFGRAPVGTLVELKLMHDVTQGEAVLSIHHQAEGLTPAARMQIYQRALDQCGFSNEHLGMALAAKVCRLYRMRFRFETVPGQGNGLRLTMKTEARACATAASRSMAASGPGVPETTS